MMTMRSVMKRITNLGVILMMGAVMNANAGLFGLGGTSWKEEVLLHDGTKIIVERQMKRGGRHEITSGPPIKEHSISFALPGTSKAITWRDEYNEDVGSASLLLLALHIGNKVPYLVAEPYGCIAYNKYGRPNPPYVIFKHDGKEWQRIPLSELPMEFKTINLVIGPSNEEKALERLGTVSIAGVDAMNRDYRQSQYRAILREPLPQARIIEMCGDMVQYRGHWVMRNSEPAKWRIDRMLDQKK